MDDSSGLASSDTVAEIQHAGYFWYLEEGESARFGRSSDCAVRIGTDPEDLEVPGQAGNLRRLDGQVWVRSNSDSPIYVHRRSGPELVIDSKGMVLAPAATPFRVLVKGRIMTYTIAVDPSCDPARKVMNAGKSPPTPDDSMTTARTVRRILTAAEKVLVVALCERLLTRSGAEARPATYEEIAARLDRSPHTVRNQIYDLRQRLRGLYIPDVSEDYERSGNAPDAKDVLAQYMWRRREVTEADLSLLDPPEAPEATS